MPSLGDMEIRRMKLADLKVADYNPRKMSDQARQGLGSSIGRFGMLVPIVWNERTGNIVGGHQRYEHLLAIGEEETDVVVVDLSEDREVALNIAMNSKQIRGDFTQEVVGLLEMSEAQIGSAFKEIGLFDLYNYVRRLKFGDAPPDPGQPGGIPDRRQDAGGGNDDSGGCFERDGFIAVISCPRCGSRWRMGDNKVVHNAIAHPEAGGDNDRC